MTNQHQTRPLAMWGGETSYYLGHLHGESLSPAPAVFGRKLFPVPAFATTAPAKSSATPAALKFFPAENFIVPAGRAAVPAIPNNILTRVKNQNAKARPLNDKPNQAPATP